MHLMGGVEAVPAQFRSYIVDNGRQVALANQQLTSVPDWLHDFPDLTTLDLGGNSLGVLPDWLGDLSSLTSLDLGGNQLTTLPQSLGNLAHLRTLNLNSNRLAGLPDSFCHLTRLQTLDLGGNVLRELPSWIDHLTHLTWLSLYGNLLPRLPDSIGNLRNLDTVDLLAVGLDVLPDSIGQLGRLSKLILRGNNLTALPESLSELSALLRLDLRDNQLSALPRSLADVISRGTDVQLDGNPLIDPPAEIVQRGSSALITYLRSLEDAVAQYEGKLLMVGEGNVGKTSLVAALRGAPFIDGRPTTHGIEIWQLGFHHPELDQDMTLRSWISAAKKFIGSPISSSSVGMHSMWWCGTQDRVMSRTR